MDVGTGSGVFAIWAAARGCRVLGIDVSSRALATAAENAERNGIPVVRDFDSLRPGTICLKQLKFGPGFASARRCANAFDFVFLNPPYNPTCPGVRVAIHAESGEDAQRAFREQIVLAPKVLKRGGWCIGNQMTVGRAGDWDALHWIKRAFRSRGQMGWCDILDAPETATGPFLREQYSTYLHRTDRGRPTAAQVSAYVAGVSSRWPMFGLIYYEINNLGGVYRSQKLRRCFRPAATWSDRVVLHREIVERSPSAPLRPDAVHT
ncbi:MAG TPA: methyltransferase domain-containing protein [Vicinamibacterales bacterium]|nr:methyltransferase domain-containing protein [Vicinamibacterales bacterium]